MENINNTENTMNENEKAETNFIAKDLKGNIIFRFNLADELTDLVEDDDELELENIVVEATNKYDRGGWFEAIYDKEDECDRENVVDMIEYLDDIEPDSDDENVVEWAVFERCVTDFDELQGIVGDAEVVSGGAEEVCETWARNNDYYQEIPDAVWENVDFDGMLDSLKWNDEVAEIGNGDYIVNADNL